MYGDIEIKIPQLINTADSEYINKTQVKKSEKDLKRKEILQVF